MRHRRRYKRLGRSPSHRKALLASLVCNLIEEKRVTTTLAKAKVARSFAERMITFARQGSLAARRRVLAELRQQKRVTKLFSEIVPQLSGRQGGYTRIIKLGRRPSDSSEMAILEWTGIVPADKRKKKKAEAEAEKKA